MCWMQFGQLRFEKQRIHACIEWFEVSRSCLRGIQPQLGVLLHIQVESVLLVETVLDVSFLQQTVGQKRTHVRKLSVERRPASQLADVLVEQYSDSPDLSLVEHLFDLIHSVDPQSAEHSWRRLPGHGARLFSFDEEPVSVGDLHDGSLHVVPTAHHPLEVVATDLHEPGLDRKHPVDPIDDEHYYTESSRHQQRRAIR